MKYSYLETRSHCVNTSFIIQPLWCKLHEFFFTKLSFVRYLNFATSQRGPNLQPLQRQRQQRPAQPLPLQRRTQGPVL
jgi:hypothetical protein